MTEAGVERRTVSSVKTNNATQDSKTTQDRINAILFFIIFFFLAGGVVRVIAGLAAERDHDQDEQIACLIKAVDRIREKLVVCPTCVPLSGANMGVDAMLDLSPVKHMARQIREEEAADTIRREKIEGIWSGAVAYETTLQGPSEKQEKDL